MGGEDSGIEVGIRNRFVYHKALQQSTKDLGLMIPGSWPWRKKYEVKAI